MSDVTRSNRPHDRLTRLAAEMTALLESKGDQVSDVRAIVMLHDASAGGIQLWNYDDDDTAAMADLLTHLRAVFRAQGKDLHLIPLNDRRS